LNQKKPHKQAPNSEGGFQNNPFTKLDEPSVQSTDREAASGS
jgi:hypothetical protein